MDLLALQDFSLVATHGGFGLASRASGKPKATLSRRVAELEAELGIRLLERGPRMVRLTEAGRMLHARAGPLLGELAEIGSDVAAGAERPRGRLRVSAPVLLANTVLGDIAARFAAAHPEVMLDIEATDRVIDPVPEGFDVMIRVDPRPDAQFTGRCVMRDERWLVASPAAPRPGRGNPDAVPLRVACRKPPTPDEVWRIHDGPDVLTVTPVEVMRLSTLPMLRDAVMAGAVPALLPRHLVGPDVAAGRLACWGWLEAPSTEIWALHLSRRLASPKVTAFIDHLVRSLGHGNLP